MKQRKTRVQKAESELRQAKKTISDLEKCIAALSERIEEVHSKSESRDVKLHNHVISARGDVNVLRKETISSLDTLKHTVSIMRGTGDVMTDMIAAHLNRIVRLESGMCAVKDTAYKMSELTEHIHSRVSNLEQGFWCRLISKLLRKKVRHAAL